MYEPAYPTKDSEAGRVKTDPWLPIVVGDVAKKLGMRSEMLFGRLYFHMANKYSFKQDEAHTIHLFELKVGEALHCVNFPFLAAVLADRVDENRWRLWTLGLSAAAVLISLGAFAIQFLPNKTPELTTTAPVKLAPSAPLLRHRRNHADALKRDRGPRSNLRRGHTMPGLKRAFEDAAAPLHNVRNNWSAMAPNKTHVAMTIWDHEFQKFASREPVLGPARPGAWRYFRNPAEYIAEWNAKRIANGRPQIDSIVGWRLLKEHLALAHAGKLPVRAVIVQSKDEPDGGEVATCESADYKANWRMELTFFDPDTGAYELAIFPA
jgi:hypothetical protein